MSLQLVANHLAQKGRGPDSTLVHMSNREVAGLQALAKKHGGELTVNPDTGLPEAGFLDSLIPTIAGAGLTYFSGGAINPLMAAGIVGGISALDSKDLGKGLMAGLGAWGGGSMVGGFAGMGLGEGVSATATAPAQEAAMQAAKGDAYKNAVGQGASSFGSMFASKPMETIASFGGGSGLNAGRTLFAAAAPAIMADQNVKTTTPSPNRGMIRPQTFSRQQTYPQQEYTGPVSGERRYFNDSYTAGDPYSAANGGLVALARGGYAEQPLFRPTTPLPENNMYGASRDAYNYLMGVNPSSSGGQTRPYDPNYPINDIRIDDGKNLNPNTPKTGKGRYEFDPITGQYKWIPDPITPVNIAPPVFENPMQAGGSGRGGREPEDPNSFSAQWAAMSDAEKEAYRAENPKTAMAQDLVKYALIPGGLLLGGVQSLYKNIVGPDVSSPASTGMTGLPNSDPIAIANKYEQDKAANPMSQDPAQQAAIRDAINNTNFSGMDRGSTSNAPEGHIQGAGAASPSGPPSGSMSGNAPPSGAPAPSAPSGESNPGDSGRGGGGAGRDGGYGGGGDGAAGRGEPGGDRGGWGRGGGYAHGGIADLYNLGSYSDGGRLLKGPGDGVSDDIPATIGDGQPARLADGEFVVPARIVSELGNGSTDAGARELYKMMDRIQAGRKKTVGKDQVAKNSKSARHLPA